MFFICNSTLVMFFQYLDEVETKVSSRGTKCHFTSAYRHSSGFNYWGRNRPAWRMSRWEGLQFCRQYFNWMFSSVQDMTSEMQVCREDMDVWMFSGGGAVIELSICKGLNGVTERMMSERCFVSVDDEQNQAQHYTGTAEPCATSQERPGLRNCELRSLTTTAFL